MSNKDMGKFHRVEREIGLVSRLGLGVSYPPFHQNFVPGGESNLLSFCVVYPFIHVMSQS